MLTFTFPSQAVLLWTDLGTTTVHETGAGTDILGGVVRRDDASTNALYFKFHVDPLSDATTEEYFAAFQLFQGNQERLAIGNALKAWAYSAFATGSAGPSNRPSEYIDLKSSEPEPSGVGVFYNYELPHWGIERTIVFKIQFRAGADDLVTVWLDPDLRPGASENNQLESLTTHFQADASFDQIRLRHGGGGSGWIFSEMAIATSFDDLVNGNVLATDERTLGTGNGSATFTSRSWQREQGLPENYVRSIAQTRDGYLWVGSDGGVSRFDGIGFFTLGSQEGFQGGRVQEMLGDREGALWIGSEGGGLSCWQHGKLQTFTRRDGLPDSITALAEDGNGRIWVGTQAGLVILEKGRPVSLKGTGQFSTQPIRTLFHDRSNVMWVGATGAGVFSYAEEKFIPLQNSSLSGLLLDPHCLIVDQKKRVWIGAGESVVLCRDGEEWRRFAIPRHLASHYISALAEGADGTVWAGSMGEGLFQFKDGKLVAINASSGLSDNLVESLLVDDEGKLWVGTHGGLNRIYPKNLSVLSHNEGLGYGAVQGLAEVRPGVIWATEANEGIYRWDGQSFRHLRLNGLSQSEPKVRTVLAAKNGSCWVAGAHGLLQFSDPETAEEEMGLPALTNLSINALAEDAKGILWAGSLEGELWRLQNGKWQPQNNGLPGSPITAITPGAGSLLWIGTDGGGLYRFELGSQPHCEKISGLPSDWIRALHLDSENALWIGTAGAGLSRWKEGKISTFTARENLPDNTISQIFEDGEGELWLAGNRGIVRVKKSDLSDLTTKKISAVYPQVYGRSDGMLSEECSGGFAPAGLKTTAGLIWFPTLKGIVVVNPLHQVKSPAPAVVLEQTLVDGLPQVAPPALAEIGVNTASKKDEGRARILRLSAGKHTLEFHYTGISFDAPERVRFKYRLEGLDRDWVEAGSRRVAFYSFVPPGNYQFKVIACNGNGIWNTAGTGLELEVLPHFWQTWWFVGILALATVTVGAVGARVIEKRKLQRRLKLLEQEGILERERTRIARDLHDMMGAKLCRISFLSEHARRSESIPLELQEEMGAISDDSREVLQSLDEMVWAVNPQKDTLDHLVSYIGQYAQEYFRRTGIECELEIPAQVPVQALSSQSRHHLFLAVHEALTNILKHSTATKARILMVCSGSEFRVQVVDNGIGFDSAARELVRLSSADGFCNGLGNMRKRLGELGGHFSIESRPGQGTTVCFVLPLMMAQNN